MRPLLTFAALCVTSASTAQVRGPRSDEAAAAARAEAEARENEGRLRGEELARELPGLEMSEELPSLLFFPALSVRIPYQVVGLSATIEALPVPWFRMSALYSFGVTPERGGVRWSSYAEAMLGVRVIGATGESAVDVPLKARGSGFPEIPVVKAWVPAHHALFVEAGGMTGLSSLQACIENCDPADAFAESPPEATQLVMPLGGIRYVYGFDLKSKRRHARARFLLEVFAHVLGPPLNAPDGPRYFPNGSSAGDAGFGGRVGISTSPMGVCIAQILFGFGCLDGGAAVGYAPYPRMILFEMQVGGFVY